MRAAVVILYLQESKKSIVSNPASAIYGLRKQRKEAFDNPKQF